MFFSNCPQNKKARESRILNIRENELSEITALKILETQVINRIAYLDTAGNGLGVVEMSDPKAALEMENLIREVLSYV